MTKDMAYRQDVAEEIAVAFEARCKCYALTHPNHAHDCAMKMSDAAAIAREVGAKYERAKDERAREEHARRLTCTCDHPAGDATIPHRPWCVLDGPAGV